MVKDLGAILGLALLTVGLWLWSAAAALVVLGTILFGCSLWGYLRDDTE